jgi:twitching motility protein PilT
MFLPDLLKATLDIGGSDLHLSIDSAPVVRVDGHLRRLPGPALTPEGTRTLAYSVLTDLQKEVFEQTCELDFAFGLPGVGRVRGNVFNQKGVVGAVFRLIPAKIRTLDELTLPPVIGQLADRPRGLVLVTGPTGSGKTTTLAAMIDHLNSTVRGHIITLEEPIEYLHAFERRLAGPDRRFFGPAMAVRCRRGRQRRHRIVRAAHALLHRLR